MTTKDDNALCVEYHDAIDALVVDVVARGIPALAALVMLHAHAAGKLAAVAGRDTAADHCRAVADEIDRLPDKAGATKAALALAEAAPAWRA